MRIVKEVAVVMASATSTRNIALTTSTMLVEIQVQCPHCGELVTTTADTSQGDYTTIEDCEVCCAPMNIGVICRVGEVEDVRVTPA